MARPFRHAPPDADPGSVLRDEVQTVLAGRFDRRVTMIVAGAGFGKTSAIVQAFEENRLRPLGDDRWLACEPADDDVAHFAEGLSVAFQLERSVSPTQLVRAAVESISSHAPSDVCVVIDDVHHLPEDSDAASLLADLVEQLPSSAHFLLSGRTRAPVPLTRLELTGQCQVLGEDDLALSSTHLARLAVEAGVEPELLGGLAGWPALVRLALRHDDPATFVIEEVLDLITEQQRAVLDVLVSIGEADEALLAAVSGVDDSSVLARVPLVDRRGDRIGAHDLWRELLADDGRRAEHRRVAAEALLERGEAARAVDVVLSQGASEGLPDVFDRALRDAIVDIETTESTRMRRWSAALEPFGVDTPARQLLVGLVRRLDNPGGDECHVLLRSAADGFLEAGDDNAAVAALGALGYAFHVRRDAAGLMSSFATLGEMAARGVERAMPYPALAGAIIATSMHDPATVLSHTDGLVAQQLPTELRGIVLWLHANALSNVGRRAVEPAAECYDIALPLPGIALIHFGARWRAGLIEDLRANPVQPLEGERDEFLLATWQCCLAAAMGDLTTARENLAVVERSEATEAQWQTPGSVTIPRAAVAYLEGDADSAAAHLRSMIQEHSFDSPGRWYYLMSLALCYPLLPEHRPFFDEQREMGPLYQRDLVLNRAVIAINEHGDLAAAGTVALPDSVSELIPALGVRNSVVVLAGAHAVGREGIETVIADFFALVGEPARREFRSLLDHSVAEVAQGAKEILESTPVAPVHRVQVSLLGGTELLIGGEAVESADWRRERVRALLAFLVLNPDTTRELAMAALWPDADAVAARRNLRSTLNVLHSVLEPQRSGGDAPFFVRSTGQRLRLVTDEVLTVDVERFERSLDEAIELEQAGIPSQSVERYRDAVETYRGDLLPDGYDDWVVFARDRLRSRFVTGAVRCAELLVATDRVDEAVSVAGRVLAIEPWAEAAHRALIAGHLVRGDHASARRAMMSCEAAMRDIGGPADEATATLARRLSRLSG